MKLVFVESGFDELVFYREAGWNWNLRAFTSVRFHFLPGSVNVMIAFSFLCPTLQTHVEGAHFNLDSSRFCIVFSCSTGLLFGFTTAVSDQYKSHFSDSLAAISGFAVTLGAIVGSVTLVDATSFRSGDNCSGFPRSRCRFRGMDYPRGAHHNEGWCFAALSKEVVSPSKSAALRVAQFGR